MFASFSLFWTAAPLLLSSVYGLSQTQIALFALVGAIGAVAAPIAGRMADAGHTEKMSKFAMVLAVISFVPGFFNLPHGVIFLALTGVLLDFAVQMNMVLGQRAVYTLDPHSRGRLNAIYDEYFYWSRPWFYIGQCCVCPWWLDLCRGNWQCFAIVGTHSIYENISAK
ncbi:hypothetical protein ABHN84_18610 [Shewanella vesiculosa]|uniref:MFS transporter n=1 Tax=Shewanella vesiculosa TaxID=518738 RepID=A0ABV0FWC4_9GAMM